MASTVQHAGVSCSPCLLYLPWKSPLLLTDKQAAGSEHIQTSCKGAITTTGGRFILGRLHDCRTDQVLAALLTVLKGAKPIVRGQGRYRNGLDALTHRNGLHALGCAQRLLSAQNARPHMLHEACQLHMLRVMLMLQTQRMGANDVYTEC